MNEDLTHEEMRRNFKKKIPQKQQKKETIKEAKDPYMNLTFDPRLYDKHQDK